VDLATHGTQLDRGEGSAKTEQPAVSASSQHMFFVHQACPTIVLITLTLVLQSAGMAVLIEWAKARLPRALHRFGPWRSGVLMVRLTTLLICLHMLEIVLWALFYRLYCFSHSESAFYFSATSYSTVGYGDLVLPQAWRLLGPMESITGVLMCGLSVSFLFAVVQRLVGSDEQAELVEGRSQTPGP
jgi:voltage-gated potassium channel